MGSRRLFSLKYLFPLCFHCLRDCHVGIVSTRTWEDNRSQRRWLNPSNWKPLQRHMMTCIGGDKDIVYLVGKSRGLSSCIVPTRLSRLEYRINTERNIATTKTSQLIKLHRATITSVTFSI